MKGKQPNVPEDEDDEPSAAQVGLNPQDADGLSATDPLVVGKPTELEKEEPKTSSKAKASQNEAAEVPMLFGMPLKWVSLVALTGQTTLQVYVIKFARAGGTPYLNSTVVLFAELLKTITCIFLLSGELGGLSKAISMIRNDFLGDPIESLKVSVPALAYIVQNTLIFYSLDKLSMAVQQVTYQLKILAAAVFSLVLLGRNLTAIKWASICSLVLGVVLVQVPRGHDSATAAVSSSTTAPTSESSLNDGLLGFIAVVCASFTSGFAGVYMEKVLKSANSIWFRNVQLGSFGSIIGLISALAQSPDEIVNGGLMQGYTWRVLVVIATLAFGGLLCAVVLKYADSILRQFSTALSISLTSVISWLALNEYEPDFLFLVGTFIVMMSTFTYNFEVLEFVASVVGHLSKQARVI
jgi:UDP-sugar transporter A1/2/3